MGIKLKYTVYCEVCSKEFTAGDPRTKACSNECRAVIRERNLKERVCNTCGNTFLGQKHSKYCSDRCKQDAQNKALRDKRRDNPSPDRICVICNKPFRPNGCATTCSDECSAILRKQTIEKWRADHPSWWLNRREVKKCIMCGEPCPPRHYLFCSEECCNMHRRTEDLYQQGLNNPVHEETCKVCKKKFWTTNKTRSWCSLECKDRIGAHKEFNERRAKANLMQDEMAKNVDVSLLKNPARGFPSFEFADSIGIVRLTGSICKCIRCGYMFAATVSGSSTAHAFLKGKAVKGLSPCPNCGDEQYGTRLNTAAIHELKKIFPNFTKMNYRPEWMEGLEIDLYDPERKLGIEYHGLLFHCSRRCKDNMRHKRKADLAERAGIQLIQIYETEWLQKRECVIDKIDAILHMDMTSVYARKLELKIMNSDKERAEVNSFMEENHIQGKAPYKWGVALMDNSGIVAACTFRYGTGYAAGGQAEGTDKYWELNRFASRLHTSVTGGLSRCISAFAKEHPDVDSVVSFADRRWTCPTRSAYSSSGFTEVCRVEPNYMYTKLDAKKPLLNKQFMRKAAIARRASVAGSKESSVYSPDKTEFQMATELGYYRIYDAGKIKYRIDLK